MKPSEMRDKTDEELRELETELRDKLIKLEIARATQRAANTARFSGIKKDIARIKTILHERKRGLSGTEATDAVAPAGEEATA